MDMYVIAQRLFESTVGAENRPKEVERLNPRVETAVGTPAGSEVSPGVRSIKPLPLVIARRRIW
jgi:hypothetical protein